MPLTLTVLPPEDMIAVSLSVCWYVKELLRSDEQVSEEVEVGECVCVCL